MQAAITVKNLMATKPITVSPETSLVEAATIISKRSFSGLPVVDKHNVLVGVITEHDFLTKGSAIHLPTFLKLMQGFDMYQNDKIALGDDVKKILKMRVRDVMNSEPLTLPETASVEDGLRMFAEHHRVNPIPVVDENKKVVGVLTRHDIIKLFGSPSVAVGEGEADRPLDRDVNAFISDFEKQFLFVSKTRTKYWLLWSLLFAVVGFIIAFALIVRIGPGH